MSILNFVQRSVNPIREDPFDLLPDGGEVFFFEGADFLSITFSSTVTSFARRIFEGLRMFAEILNEETDPLIRRFYACTLECIWRHYDIKQLPEKARAAAIRAFINRYFNNGEGFERPSVLVTDSGYRYLIDGHHRIAALLKAVSQGVVPRDWLEEPIPVLHHHYQSPYPVKLFHYLITSGVDLGWKDLFPH